MKIGIDIDDVLTDTSVKMVEYLKKYEKSGDGKKYLVEIMRGEIPTSNIKDFFDNYINEICKNAELKNDAREVLKRLSDNGHEIIFITSRGETRFPGTEKTTLEYLKNNNIEYFDIIFNSFEKQKDCLKKNIEIMIDDSVKNCELVKSVGINSIVYTSEVNKNIDTKIKRINNWLELENIINEM